MCDVQAVPLQGGQLNCKKAYESHTTPVTIAVQDLLEKGPYQQFLPATEHGARPRGAVSLRGHSHRDAPRGHGKKLAFHDPAEVQNLAFPSPLSARDNAEYVAKECQAALDDGSALLVDYSFARVINLILVDIKQRNGKQRLCLDLRYPNRQTTAAAKFKWPHYIQTCPWS